MDRLVTILARNYEAHIVDHKDFIIKAKEQDDCWMRIKYIITNKESKLNDEFEDYLLIFHPTAFNRYYVMSRNEIDSSSVRIANTKKSKYDKYACTKEELFTRISKYISIVKLYPFDIAKSNELIVPRAVISKKAFTFQQVCDLVKEKDCQVVSHADTYTWTKGPIRIKYSCGHEVDTTYNNFMRKNTQLCPSCIAQTYKENNFDDEQNAPSHCVKEAEMIDHMSNILGQKFEVIRTNEACTADMIIRPKDVAADLWLPLQFKGTYITMCQYTFQLKEKNYNNMIMICFAEVDKRYWMMNGSIVSGMKSLSIGKKLSQYSRYEIASGTICDELNKAYIDRKYNKLDILLLSEHILMTPKGDVCNKEHQYKMIREKELGNIIDIVYPKVHMSKTDCMIYGKKIQDKVAYQDNRGGCDTLFVLLNCSKKYYIGDNDFYWAHFLDERYKSKCIILPERMIAGENDIIKTKISVYMDKNKFEEFTFDYNNFDLERFKKLFRV